jgi:CRP-like cAMP-binding protein
MNQDQIVRVLTKSPLFSSIREEEIPSFLECLHAKSRSFGRGSTIFTVGDAAQMGVVLSGELRIQTEDLEGRQSILTVLKAPDLFGEVFALSQTKSSVTAFTETGCEVLFLDTVLLTAVCSKACPFHRQFIWNLLFMVTQKNVALNRKIQCISQRTTREKVEAFLQEYRAKTGKDSFTIPFNRAEMADYLCVERSALSAVLSQMKQDKIITYQKNLFQIL